MYIATAELYYSCTCSVSRYPCDADGHFTVFQLWNVQYSMNQYRVRAQLCPYSQMRPHRDSLTINGRVPVAPQAGPSTLSMLSSALLPYSSTNHDAEL